MICSLRCRHRAYLGIFPVNKRGKAPINEAREALVGRYFDTSYRHKPVLAILARKQASHPVTRKASDTDGSHVPSP